jgi:hypothetical protein
LPRLGTEPYNGGLLLLLLHTGRPHCRGQAGKLSRGTVLQDRGRGEPSDAQSAMLLRRWAAPALVLSMLLIVLLAMARVELTLLSIAGILSGALVVVLAGECTLGLVRVGPVAARSTVAIVIGAVATSLALVVGVCLTGLTAGNVFVAWSIAVLGVAFAQRGRLMERVDLPFVDVAAQAAIAAIIVAGCSVAATAVPVLKATGVLPVWIDYYIHAATIANFGLPDAAGHGDILMVGAPLTFYHYGPYQLAAALMAVVDASSLALATAVLLPLGLYLAAVSVYALAAQLVDRRAGVLALAVLIVVPDVSSYGLANGFFDHRWMLFTHPGSGYGIAVCAVSLILFLVWMTTREWRALALALALACAVIEIRAHYFVVVAPALAATLALATPFGRRHATFLWGGGLLAVAMLLSALVMVEPLQRLWLENSAIEAYLENIHSGQQPTAYSGVYAGLVARVGQIPALFIGTALMLPAALGVFVVAYPLALAAALRRRGWRQSDALPLLVLIAFVLVTLLAPASRWDDATEYQHRPVVLVYVLIVVWTSAYAADLLRSTGGSPVSVAAQLGGIAAIVIFAVGIFGVDPGAPGFSWANPNYYRTPIAPGIIGAAEAIRQEAEPGDIVAVGPAEADADLVDHATQITSLAHVPTLLARYRHQLVWGEEMRNDAQRRLALLRQVEGSDDFAQVIAWLRDRGVTWYVWLGEDGPAFDRERRMAAVKETNVAVYRIVPLGQP